MPCPRHGVSVPRNKRSRPRAPTPIAAIARCLRKYCSRALATCLNLPRTCLPEYTAPCRVSLPTESWPMLATANSRELPMIRDSLLLASALVLLCGCNPKESSAPVAEAAAPKFTAADNSIPSRVGKYATVRLTTDLSRVSPEDRRVLGHFVTAAGLVNDIYWQQAYGDPKPLLDGISDPKLKRLVEINFGPWDRIDANTPFVAGVGPKPAGAQFYPADMTRAEFDAFTDPGKTGLYSLVRRDAGGKLVLVPYSHAYAAQLKLIAGELRA